MHKLSILIILGVIMLCSIAYGDNKKVQIKPQIISEWKVIHTTDKDAYSLIQNPKALNTEICLIDNTASNRALYDAKNNIIKTINPKNNNGKKEYCFKTKGDKKYKLGEHSTTYEYISTLVFDYEWGQTNVTLTCINATDIQQDYKQIDDKWEFSASIKGNQSLYNCGYKLKSNSSMIYVKTFSSNENAPHGWDAYPEYYVFDNMQNPEIRHYFSLLEICQSEWSQCIYENSHGNYSAEINFISNYSIDPTVYTTIGCVTANAQNAVYKLVNSIIANANPCINVIANNVTIDCQNYQHYTNQTPIYIQFVSTIKNNTVIKNCNVKGYTTGSTGYGVYIENANQTTIKNATFSGLINAIKAYNSMNANITNIKSNWSISSSIYLSKVNNFTVENATILNASRPGPRTFIRNSAIDIEKSTSTKVIDLFSDNSSKYAVCMRNSSNTLIANSTFINSGYTAIMNQQSSKNGTILNCSYEKARENVTSGYILRKWYYTANVTDIMHNALSAVNIAISNNTALVENILTNNDGIGITEIIDYFNNGTVTNYSNYTFVASLMGYNNNQSQWNISTSNNTNDIFELDIAAILSKLIIGFNENIARIAYQNNSINNYEGIQVNFTNQNKLIIGYKNDNIRVVDFQNSRGGINEISI